MSAKVVLQTEPGNGLIFGLIPKVMAEVGFISKGRKNSAQGYNFRGVDDVYAAFQGPLSKHGVFYIPEVIQRDSVERATKSGGTMVYTTLTVAYTFFAPDGSCVRAVVIGEAMDSGDKSANKAMSAALKYALLQIFCVPCEASDDADSESHEIAPRQPARPVAVATKPEIGSGSQPQGVKLALQNQIDWLTNRLGDEEFKAECARLSCTPESLTFEDASGLIKSLGKAK